MAADRSRMTCEGDGWLADVVLGLLEALPPDWGGPWRALLIDGAAGGPGTIRVRSDRLGGDLGARPGAAADSFQAAVGSLPKPSPAAAGIVVFRRGVLALGGPDPARAEVIGWSSTSATTSARTGVPVRIAYGLPADEGQSPLVRARVRDIADRDAVAGIRWLVHPGAEAPGPFPLLAALIRGHSGESRERRPGDFNEVVASALFETACEVLGVGRRGAPAPGWAAEVPHRPPRDWQRFLDRAHRVTKWTRWEDLYADAVQAPERRCLTPWLAAPDVAGVFDRDVARILSRWALPSPGPAASWFVSRAAAPQRTELAGLMRSCHWLKPWAPPTVTSRRRESV